jgi:hypothetical protein
MFQRFEATDPRDRVYALLGLAPDVQKHIHVDYDKPVPEVWEDAARFLLNKSPPGHQFEILGYFSNINSRIAMSEHPEIGMPTWVPDMDLNIAPIAFPKTRKRKIQQEEETVIDWAYSAGILLHPAMIPEVEATFDLVINGDFLQAKGFLIDAIKEVNRQTETPRLGGKWYRDVVRSWEPKDGQKPYTLGRAMQQAYLRTIVADLKFDQLGNITGCSSASDQAESILSSSALVVTYTESVASLDVIRFCRNRTLAYTSRGHVSLVPIHTEVDHEIWILIGGQVLSVVATIPGKEYKSFAGECYVHGLMKGEALDWLRDGRAKLETVVIG